ncbi:hypothetical protein ACWIUD_06240 [Helicobacter sp. 23-1044]
MSVVLDLPQDLQDAYTFFAKEQDISKEKLMQKALEAYLEDLEDLVLALQGRKDRLQGDSGIEANEFYAKIGI